MTKQTDDNSNAAFFIGGQDTGTWGGGSLTLTLEGYGTAVLLIR